MRAAISPAKLAASLLNLEKANAANKLRPRTTIPKVCESCSKPFLVKPSHFDKKTYCSRECMVMGYRRRFSGAKNPNYKNAGSHFCLQCGLAFKDYNKTKKFCSFKCYSDSIPAEVANLGNCGTDRNQGVIVEALRSVGVSVLITSFMGRGFPDLITGYNGINRLLEIKNLNSYYGRQGLNARQKQFVEGWQGKVFLVTNVEDAIVVATVPDSEPTLLKFVQK